MSNNEIFIRNITFVYNLNLKPRFKLRHLGSSLLLKREKILRIILFGEKGKLCTISKISFVPLPDSLCGPARNIFLIYILSAKYDEVRTLKYEAVTKVKIALSNPTP